MREGNREENIMHLMARFQSLGFGVSVDGAVEAAVRASLCFQKERFEIRDVLVREGDTCIVTVLCAMEPAKNAFDTIYYDVVLRKAMVLDEVVINGVEVQKLNAVMREINWVCAYQGKLVLISDSLPGVEQTKKIETILYQLAKLGESSDGERVANQLRFHHWVDTILEQVVSNFSSLRWQYEISQRFYFFEEEQPISIDEAYRFLKSKWIEKQWQFRKRQVDKLPAGDGAGGGAGDGTRDEKAGGKLITRRGKAGRKPLLGK